MPVLQLHHPDRAESRIAPTAVLKSTLPEADMLRIKQLLLEGQRQAAENLYIQMSGASPQAAQEALADLGRKLSLDVVRHQQLTPPGILLVGSLRPAYPYGGVGVGQREAALAGRCTARPIRVVDAVFLLPCAGIHPGIPARPPCSGRGSDAV